MRPRLRGIFTVWRGGHTPNSLGRRVATGLLLAVGLGLTLRLLARVGWRAVLDGHGLGHPAVLLVFVAPVVGNFVHMLGWRALLPPPLRPKVWRAFRTFVAAQAGNELGLGLLGEPIKVTAFAREHRAAAVKAVVLDNVASLFALVAVVLSVGCLLGRSTLSVIAPQLSAIAVGAVLGLLVLCSVALSKWRSLVSERPGAVLIAFTLHYLAKLWIVAEMALALAFVATASPRSSALLGLSSILGSAVGAPVPGQLGVVETALAFAAPGAGLSLSAVLSVAVLRRLRSVLWVLIGAFLFFFLDRAPLGKVRAHASTAADC